MGRKEPILKSSGGLVNKPHTYVVELGAWKQNGGRKEGKGRLEGKGGRENEWDGKGTGMVDV